MKTLFDSGAGVFYVFALLLLLLPFLVFGLAEDEGTGWLAVLLLGVCWPAGALVGLFGDQLSRKYLREQNDSLTAERGAP